MTQNFASAGVYLIQTFFGLYTFLVMLRFLMQVARADYYNPISQGIVKLTDPAIRPLRKLFPTIYGVDLATLCLAFLVQLAAIMIIMALYGYAFFALNYVAWVLLGLFAIIFKIYFFALLVSVVASWIAPASNHPALSLVYQLIEPICAPARKLLPPMGGIDFSIILVFVFINLIDSYLVIQPLSVFLGVPRGLILGL